MHLPYMCASIYAHLYMHLRKLSSVNAHLYAHLYVSFVYALIWKHTYKEDAIMEVANFHICVVRICTFTEVASVYAHLYIQKAHIQKMRIYGRRHYGSGQLPYMRSPYMCIYGSRRPYMHRLYMCIYGSAHIQKMPLWKWPASVYASFIYAAFTEAIVYASSVYAHIRKVHIRKKFMVIQMHLPYMRASIYAHLRKLSSVNAHLYAFIFVIRICAYTEARIYKRCHYGSGQLPYMRSPYMRIYGSRRPYMRRMCRSYMRRPYMRIYRSAHIQKVHIWKTPLWKWSASIYALSVYAHLWKSLSVYASSVYAHIRKHAYTKGAYTNDAYMEGAYTKEIYGNPNASSVYVCFHICTFKEVVIVNAHL
jgi:hypothetical protein